MKKVLTEEQLKTIINAQESVRGTLDYCKYDMCYEYKYRKNGKWTPWTYITWTIPMYGNANDYYFKTVKDKLYIINECPSQREIYRYEVTPAVRELLGM